jgi:hypothetical protein
MKRRKLALSRETLRILRRDELNAFGGTSYTPETCGVCSGGCTGLECSVTDCSVVCVEYNTCNSGRRC